MLQWFLEPLVFDASLFLKPQVAGATDILMYTGGFCVGPTDGKAEFSIATATGYGVGLGIGYCLGSWSLQSSVPLWFLEPLSQVPLHSCSLWCKVPVWLVPGPLVTSDTLVPGTFSKSSANTAFLLLPPSGSPVYPPSDVKMYVSLRCLGVVYRGSLLGYECPTGCNLKRGNKRNAAIPFSFTCLPVNIFSFVSFTTI